MKINRFLILGSALALGFLLLLVALLSADQVGLAAPALAPAAELHVCATCTYTTVQAAVDAASDDDVIKVAAGVYTGVHGRVAPPGLTGIFTQVVYLDKSVTIQGGYTTAFSEPPDPEANPTTLDAQGQGRVLVVWDYISPTIAGLRITGGDETRQSGNAGDSGGGVYIKYATATFTNNLVFSNTAEHGGGIQLDNSDSILSNNTIISNTATAEGGGGGGVHLFYSDGAILRHNTIAGNAATVEGNGGGVASRLSDGVTFIENSVTENRASGDGGGVYLSGSLDSTIISNTISTNIAASGGGLHLQGSSDGATVSGNTIAGNVADESGKGGGIRVWGSDFFTLTGNIIISNTAGMGGGIDLDGDAILVTGNTIMSNTAVGDGGGILVQGYGAMVVSRNTIDANAARRGGGVHVYLSDDSALDGNTITANTAEQGGGLYINQTAVTLDGNLVVANIADEGGGLYLNDTDNINDNAVLSNTVVADNQAHSVGSGLYVTGRFFPRLLHTTIARNVGGDGSGIHIATPSPYHITVALTNTILTGHSVGITVTAGSTATLNGVLWYNNATVNSGGAGTIAVTHAYTGNPAFAADGYHLTAYSAAIDRGVDAGVDDDVDGETRPQSAAPDLGADEYPGTPVSLDIVKSVVPTGQVDRGDVLTYTLLISAAPGVQLALYDPLADVTFAHFVQPLAGIVHTDGAVTGTLAIPPGGLVTVSFAVQVGDVPTQPLPSEIVNRARACLVSGTGSSCIWSNEAANPTLEPSDLPDLVITDLWWGTDRVWYQIRNDGAGVAPQGRHCTRLHIEGALQSTDCVDVDLAPGERATRWLGYISIWSLPRETIEVCADYDNGMKEENEANNCRVEGWQRDITPPQITYGPVVSETTASTALIYWRTDEESDSVVRYARNSARYSLEERSTKLVQDHLVTLTGLAPASVYHYTVQSTDAASNTVTGEEGFFTTAPASDVEPPTISEVTVTRAEGDYEFYTVSASVSDNTGVARVEFLLDGEPIGTDYAGEDDNGLGVREYEIGMAPAELDFARDEWFAIEHTWIIIASDFDGEIAQQEGTYIPADEPMDVDVQILSPVPDYGIYIDGSVAPAGTTVDLEVYAVEYAWACNLFTFEDWGGSLLCPAHKVETVEFYVDDVLVHTISPDPGEFRPSYTWDAGGLGLGTHTIDAKAISSDGVGHWAEQHTVTVIQGEPSIDLQRHVSVQGNVFTVTLVLENLGTAAAPVDRIQDNVKVFQAVGRETEHYTVATSYHADQVRTYVEIDLFADGEDSVTIAPGETFAVSYAVVPILSPYLSGGSIGETYTLVYYGTSPVRQDAFPRACAVGCQIYDLDDGSYSPLSEAIYYAKQAADYLIVTNPSRLFRFYDSDEVDVLLSAMAHLASLQRGVLGYLYAYEDPTDSLELYIELGGSWTVQLHPDFSTADGGYLLIVGETGIVPARTLSLRWGDWDYEAHTRNVPFSDQGYASIPTPWDTPSLRVGRIVGDDAAALTKPIQTSINAHIGAGEYGFDRSDVLLTSGLGIGRSPDTYIDNVDEIAGDVASQYSIHKLHWSEEIHLSSLLGGYETGDGLAAGNVWGGSAAEIVVASDDDDRIYVLSMNGAYLEVFYQPFDEGDGLAVGDVDGDGTGEIIFCHADWNIVSVHAADGGYISSFRLSDYQKFDGLAAGDVNGDGTDEIVWADRSHNRVYVFDGDGNWLYNCGEGYDQQCGFAVEYVQEDDLAVGDVGFGAEAEIVIGDASQDAAYVYSAVGSPLSELTTAFDGYQDGDQLAVGDVNGDGWDEILFGDASEDVIRVCDATGGVLETIPCNCWYKQLDALAAGDVVEPGDGKDEIVIGDGDSHIHITDPYYAARLYDTFTAPAPDADVIYYHGAGDAHSWGDGLNAATPGHFPLDFGDTNPVIFALADETGNYDAWPDQIAQALFDNGAAVYIGATKWTRPTDNAEAGRMFFEEWQAAESTGDAFTDLERDVYSLYDAQWYNHCKDWLFWAFEYNYYGDPKYGSISPIAAAVVPELAIIQAPLTPLQVEIPDFEVITTTTGWDGVRIPGGYVWIEPGGYQVPYWSTSLDYVQGARVQDVALVERTGLVTSTGLLIPTTTVELEDVLVYSPSHSAQEQWWFPEQEAIYDWGVMENPDGSSTLNIILYPFYYSPLTTDVEFYKNYSFEIDVITTTAQVTRLATDEHTYAQNEEVHIDLWLENTGDAQDVIVSTVVKAESSAEVVDGLLLQALNDLTGQATFALDWDSTGFAAGYYVVEAELWDTEGNLLDRVARGFRLGVISGEITTFTATPATFDVGDTISITLVFSNTGTVPITGTAVIQVQDGDSEVIETFNHAITNLAPTTKASFEDGWDTFGVPGGTFVAPSATYRILGYVLYDAKSTDPQALTVNVRAGAYIYLPIILRSE